ncbi:MAG: phage major capsid protein [Methanotrichaceae archaeon]
MVYGQTGVINKDYEGEIKGKADTVRITGHGPISISDYDPAVGLSDPEDLDDAQTTLVCDQAKSFNFRVGDIDKAQTSVALMQSATTDSGYQLSDVADKYIAGVMAAQAGNKIGSDAAPKVFDGETDLLTTEILATKQALDEANVPSEGRWMVLPPWLTVVLMGENAITSPIWSGIEGVMLNGKLAKLYGFEILQSNNVPDNGSDALYKILAGTSRACTFADSVNEVEAYRPEKFFADALRGLHVYGALVVEPAALAVLTCSKA